ncbi:DUF2255 family protein [Actinoplanes solisilvae]|uniref:DUF2255 family protein n=1 Tax=Actinoplanes solisilvae TaxID=2486853 RepID=UPI000FD85A72|nr:DUF2255 family protein [Actinoplanes solisilvae]
MSTWSEQDLTAIGGADELDISSRRGDGTLRPYVTIWVVRVGDDLCVRSAYGANNGWYRRARAAGIGSVRVGGVEREVTFADSPADPAVVDRAYHDKYDRYGPAIVGTVTGPEVGPLTLRLLPKS